MSAGKISESRWPHPRMLSRDSLINIAESGAEIQEVNSAVKAGCQQATHMSAYLGSLIQLISKSQQLVYNTDRRMKHDFKYHGCGTGSNGHGQRISRAEYTDSRKRLIAQDSCQESQAMLPATTIATNRRVTARLL